MVQNRLTLFTQPVLFAERFPPLVVGIKGGARWSRFTWRFIRTALKHFPHRTKVSIYFRP